MKFKVSKKNPCQSQALHPSTSWHLPTLAIPHPLDKELPFGLSKDGHRLSVPSLSVLDAVFFVVPILCTHSLSVGEMGKMTRLSA